MRETDVVYVLFIRLWNLRSIWKRNNAISLLFIHMLGTYFAYSTNNSNSSLFGERLKTSLFSLCVHEHLQHVNVWLKIIIFIYVHRTFFLFLSSPCLYKQATDEWKCSFVYSCSVSFFYFSILFISISRIPIPCAILHFIVLPNGIHYIGRGL